MEHLDPVQKVIILYIPFLFALCVHEFSHGYIANKLGDPTAKLMGRLTLNPIPHLDIVGTVILPILGMFSGFPILGWAKPVPVNSRNLTDKKYGMFWVALAGPGSNLIMGLIGAFLFVITAINFPENNFVVNMSQAFISINLYLALLNLIPLHPLDGAKIFEIFLPANVNRKLQDLQVYSGILLMILFYVGVLGPVLQAVEVPLANLMVNLAVAVVKIV